MAPQRELEIPGYRRGKVASGERRIPGAFMRMCGPHAELTQQGARAAMMPSLHAHEGTRKGKESRQQNGSHAADKYLEQHT